VSKIIDVDTLYLSKLNIPLIKAYKLSSPSTPFLYSLFRIIFSACTVAPGFHLSDVVPSGNDQVI